MERLLGLDLTHEHFDRGSAHIDGMVQRAGHESLKHLWSDTGNLPTPNDVVAPGLWLARIDL